MPYKIHFFTLLNELICIDCMPSIFCHSSFDHNRNHHCHFKFALYNIKNKSKKLETMRLSSILPPKSANLVFNNDSKQAVSYRKNIYQEASPH